MQIAINVPAERVSNLLVSAFEGGSSYWVWSAMLLSGKETTNPWYADPTLFENDFSFEVRYDDPTKPEGNGEGVAAIHNADIITGLTLMARNSPSHFGDLLSENDDATTADVFLQYVVLGDVIYG